MDVKAEIKKIDDIDDGAEGLRKVREIARFITGEDIILEIQETLRDEDGDHKDSTCIIVDFSKLECLDLSWRYISSILQTVLLGLLASKREISYEASLKYSFLDTLSASEILAVEVEATPDRKYVYAYGDLCY